MSADPTGKTVQTIVEAVLRRQDEQGDRLVLPKFQRTVVWSRPKQIDLVDSRPSPIPGRSPSLVEGSRSAGCQDRYYLRSCRRTSTHYGVEELSG
jgi:hypothetical protein